MSRRLPRVVIECGDYVSGNIGDQVMLDVATGRLRTLLPDAFVELLNEPRAYHDSYRSLFPDPAQGDRRVLGRGGLRAVLGKALPARLVGGSQRWAPGKTPTPGPREKRLLQAIEDCDLLVVSGQGGICDVFPDYSAGLDTIELAVRYGRRVALVGQGIGPLQDPQLRKRVARVLPKVDLIALREKLAGLPLLLDLGVDPARILVTGDDAVELGYGLRAGALGLAIGFNLRVAYYSGVNEDLAAKIGQVVSEAAGERSSPLVPVPVSRIQWEDDLDAMRDLFPDLDEEMAVAADIRTPRQLIRQIQRCRLVVAGSYHAGVFALSSGIPVVGIAGSRYYRDKFNGLADMFGVGCEVVVLGDKSPLDALRSSIGRLWDSADECRGSLLKAAQAQITAGNAAYRKVADLAMRASRS